MTQVMYFWLMKIDVLAFAAHPDDVELTAAGTLLRHKEKGYTIGIVDLTQGELGTRGNAETRKAESQKASQILGLDIRENLGMSDGFFENNQANQLLVIEAIRAYQPEIILCNSVSDRHIDHGRASKLVSDAAFLSGLVKIETHREGLVQKPWRPKAVYHYIQDRYIHPDLVVDITPYFEQKQKAILAYETQFYNSNNEMPQTPISSKDFLDFLEGRALEFGRIIGTRYGEGFTVERSPGVDDLMGLS